jgi:type III restriction enzyme
MIERAKIRLQNDGVIISPPTVSVDDKMSKEAYPDIVKRLEDSTGLTRKTIIEVLKKSRFEDFRINQEEYISRVNIAITNHKLNQIKAGVKYEKIDEYYKMEEIFSDDDLYVLSEYLLKTESNKHLFDYVIFDSKIEKDFANSAEADEDVLLYTKLPPKFQIDTPFGNYNPDWAMIVKREGREKLYFVIETKGVINIDELERLLPEQHRKALSGKRHFASLEKDVDYSVVNSLATIKKNI